MEPEQWFERKLTARTFGAPGALRVALRHTWVAFWRQHLSHRTRWRCAWHARCFDEGVSGGTCHRSEGSKGEPKLKEVRIGMR